MRIALAAVLSLALLGCEDQNRVAEQKRVEQTRVERDAKRKAEDEAERDLMKSPALAIPELQKRLSDWLTVSEGVATIVVGSSYARVHAMPARSSWLVSCDSGGIEVAITNGASEEVHVRRLTRARLTNDDCRLLASAIGKHMVGLLGK